MKEDNIIRGRDMIERYCKAKGINWAEIGKPEYMEKVMARYASRTGNPSLPPSATAA